MMRALIRLARDRSAAAAVEMAMVLPLLLVIAYASFEMGNYFLTEHVVQKAARDAARYAARLPMTNYPDCTTVPVTTIDKIEKVARTGRPDGTASNRIYTWTGAGMTQVEITCATGQPYSTGGVYQSFPAGAPVVTVTATVPYGSLWGNLGFKAMNLYVYGRSQTAVFGA